MATDMKTKKVKQPRRIEIALPDGIQATVEKGYNVQLQKGDKKVMKRLAHKTVVFDVQGSKLIIQAKDATRTAYKMCRTYEAHIKNMIKGVSEGHTYTLKICSGHFPMNVSLREDTFEIKNFLGEKVPRVYKIKGDTKVQIKGNEIIVESISKEAAGQTAADIEQLTRIKKKDRRIFQDGIFITNKDGKSLA